MVKGTLKILKTKKGFAAKVVYQKKSGKQGELPVTAYRPENDDFDGTECSFEREGGTLIKLVAHDGTVLFNLKASRKTEAKKSTSSSSNTGGNKVPDSYDPSKAFFPEDTMSLLSESHISPDNFCLKWQKAARYDSRKKNFQFFKRERKGENFEIKPEFGSLAFNQIAERSLRDAQGLLGSNNTEAIELSIDWRLVQGLGGSSVYETSMSLHHIYGTPFISSNSLKGVVRNYIISNVYLPEVPEAAEDKGPDAEKLALENPVFTRWFGDVGQKGNLVFFDAFPIEEPSLEVDIMNPHYSPYYSDPKSKTPPADYFNPIPVPFLTVSKTRFKIIFGALDGSMLKEDIEGKSIKSWLKEALTHHGIGAKTAVGYGYFKT
ncbi:MAG: type III-B CRISPR module RAMP protein Cmr6 [bacterium]|nr:type III-B CRISPR module RAMP protein Cmr6 [bacterium]